MKKRVRSIRMAEGSRVFRLEGRILFERSIRLFRVHAELGDDVLLVGAVITVACRLIELHRAGDLGIDAEAEALVGLIIGRDVDTVGHAHDILMVVGGLDEVGRAVIRLHVQLGEAAAPNALPAAGLRAEAVRTNEHVDICLLYTSPSPRD